MSADIGAYDPQTAKMILETVKYLKANGFLLQAGRKTPPIMSVPRSYIAMSTSEITERSGDQAGIGTAQLLYIPGIAGVDITIETFSAELPVYNVSSSRVESGRYIFLNREYGSGKWVVVLEDCE